DFEGTWQPASEEALIERLQSTRRGVFGAAILASENGGPLLFVHLNGDLAYLHLFPDATYESAGAQPIEMTPAGCPEMVQLFRPGEPDRSAPSSSVVIGQSQLALNDSARRRGYCHSQYV